MTDKDRVIELIESSQESDFCDFKKEFYHDVKKGDMIKDILAFANSPMYGDKYIIFNVDDKTRQLGEMNNDIIPDISKVNGLLREYCEPHIGIEMNSFIYKDSNVAYIKIPVGCTDKPYLVKKDYTREGKVLLQQGQIYLRRNSDNFKANRRDLDEIYESRIMRKAEICNAEIVEKEYIIKNNVEKYYSIDFILCNNSKENFLIDNIRVFLELPGHCISTFAKYICEMNVQKIGETDTIKNMSFSVEAYTTIQKSLQFDLSNDCNEQIRKYDINNGGLIVWLEIQDIRNQKISSERKRCQINVIK